MRAALLKAGHGFHWYLRQATGEAKRDEYVERCRRDGPRPPRARPRPDPEPSRRPASLARQAAAVPGLPRVPPARPMITLSTCATPEDHAAGNYWSDRFGNPSTGSTRCWRLVDVRRR